MDLLICSCAITGESVRAGVGILNLTGQPGIVITFPASDSRVRTSPECLYPTIREIPQSIAEVLIRDADALCTVTADSPRAKRASIAHVEGGESLLKAWWWCKVKSATDDSQLSQLPESPPLPTLLLRLALQRGTRTEPLTGK